MHSHTHKSNSYLLIIFPVFIHTLTNIKFLNSFSSVCVLEVKSTCFSHTKTMTIWKNFQCIIPNPTEEKFNLQHVGTISWGMSFSQTKGLVVLQSDKASCINIFLP